MRKRNCFIIGLIVLTFNLSAVNISFNLDMSTPIAEGQFLVGTDSLYLAGSMNGWIQPGNDPAMELTDPDSDGIYTLNLDLTSGDYEYKYFINAGWEGGEWSGDPNRLFTLVNSILVLDNTWAVNDFLITFMVSDGTNMLENVNININGSDIITDIYGSVSISLTDGNYPYTASLAGYFNINETVIVEGAPILENVILVLETFPITFTITDGSDPLEGANIHINNSDYLTDINGTVVIDLVNGNYSYVASFSGFETVIGSISVDGLPISEPVILSPVSLDEINSNILIYPNPSDGHFQIFTEHNVILEVLDIFGKIVFSGHVDGKFNFELNRKGIYFFKFSSGNEFKTEKVIVR